MASSPVRLADCLADALAGKVEVVSVVHEAVFFRGGPFGAHSRLRGPAAAAARLPQPRDIIAYIMALRAEAPAGK